ncbi:MAG: hypothetical protein HWD85_01615 [Flavobacteriaceae bacterium]|nr:hypothetical protein [Flavobacteriaceae bacterium]
MKKILIFAVLLGYSALFFNCQDNSFEELIEEKQVLAKDKPTKFIFYKGLKVRHRFKATEDELKEKYDKKKLKTLYNKLRAKYKKRGKSKTTFIANVNPEDEEELPNIFKILEASKVVLPQLPYEEIEDHVILNRINKKQADHDMIKNDFPDLTDAEIEANQATIDQYYSDNLDYMTLDEIAQNPNIYENLNTIPKTTSSSLDLLAIWRVSCILSQSLANGYGLVRASISYGLASARATESAENHYPAPIVSYDTREDAYRHILWNAMLAQYYFTISSKAPRIAFAKLVGDANESSLCGANNTADAKEMDLHNNVIGRNIWSEKTSYIQFFGATIGLSLPSITLLETVIFNKVEQESCYIVKDHGIVSYRYGISEVKNIILQMDINVPVYINKFIAPRRYVTTTTYDYSDCGGGGNIPLINNNQNTLLDTKANKQLLNIYNKNGIQFTKNLTPIIPDDEDCVKEITTTTTINACFISKDPNYNPYQ